MGIAANIREAIEDFTGYAIRETHEVERMERVTEAAGSLADDAEDLALNVMDHVGSGVNSGIQSWTRKGFAHRSRVALTHDPLAGAESNLRANFAFGRGIPKPVAADPDVQAIIDEAWSDENNRQKLTDFEAQRYRSNELLAGANLYPVAFTANGRVRIGFHHGDLVEDVVTMPEDDETAVWFAVRHYRNKWSWDMDGAMLDPNDNLASRIQYVKHSHNYDRLRREAMRWGTEAPPRPPNEDRILDGRMGHFRINRIGRTLFGTPPMARTLRFYSAMNQLTEAQVQMRQAAASIVAKRTRKGGPKNITKAAAAVMRNTGRLSASFRSQAPPNPAGAGTEPPRGAKPPPAGSWWMENEGDNLQAVNLSSGASQAAQDAQIVRAPIAAATGFGQHYLGDSSNMNLATASTLELPTEMEISAWQETFEALLRWFVDIVIEEAIHAGRLGGFTTTGDPMAELNLREDRGEMEARTGRDLSYTLAMPFPGRRTLTDTTSAVTSIASTFDPGGQNHPLRRALLDAFFRHGLQSEDPARLVDECWPEDGPAYMQNIDPATGQPINPQQAGGTGAPQGPDGAVDDANRSQYGERRQHTDPAKAQEGFGLAIPGDVEMSSYAEGFEGGLSSLAHEANPDLRRRLQRATSDEYAAIFDDIAIPLGGKRAPATANGSIPATR